MSRNAKRLQGEVISALSGGALMLFFLFALEFNLVFSIISGMMGYLAFSLLLIPERFKLAKSADMNAESFKDAEETMQSGYRIMEQLAACREAIPLASVKEKASLVYDKADKVLKYLEQNPQKIRLARKFFSYYLETAANILKRYLELSSRELQSTDIQHVLVRAEEVLTIMAGAFDKQLASLVQNEVIDLEVEVRVLKSTLESEELNV